MCKYSDEITGLQRHLVKDKKEINQDVKIFVRGRAQDKLADHQSLLPRAQRDAQREWMKLSY